jgi:hypothetical protein
MYEMLDYLLKFNSEHFNAQVLIFKKADLKNTLDNTWIIYFL